MGKMKRDIWMFRTIGFLTTWFTTSLCLALLSILVISISVLGAMIIGMLAGGSIGALVGLVNGMGTESCGMFGLTLGGRIGITVALIIILSRFGKVCQDELREIRKESGRSPYYFDS